MRGSSARGRIARLLALLLLLQGLPGAFPRLSVTAAGAFEICSGADPRRLAPPPGDVPDLPEKASCIACLLPAALAAAEPAAVPLPADRPHARVRRLEAAVGSLTLAHSSWPRAPPGGS